MTGNLINEIEFNSTNNCKSIHRGYKLAIQELQKDSNENFGGRIIFRIPEMTKAFVGKKSDRNLDGSTYKTYLSSRPQSITEANESRNCTCIRCVVEIDNSKLKRFNLLRNTWSHSKIQSQVRFRFDFC